MYKKMKKLYYRIRIKVFILFWRFRIWDLRVSGKYVIMPLYRWHIRKVAQYVVTGRIPDIYQMVTNDRYWGNRRHSR